MEIIILTEMIKLIKETGEELKKIFWTKRNLWVLPRLLIFALIMGVLLTRVF